MPVKALILLLTVAGLLGGCERDFRIHDAPDSRSALNSQTTTPVVQYGRVTVSVVEPDAIRQLAVTRTDREGYFRLPLSLPNKPLLVEIRPTHDTRVICDRSGGCGRYDHAEAMPVPDAFRLTALLTREELARGPARIDPQSHLVFRESLRLPGLVDAAQLSDAHASMASRYELPATNADLPTTASNRAWFEGRAVVDTPVGGAAGERVMNAWLKPEWNADESGCGQDCGLALSHAGSHASFF